MSLSSTQRFCNSIKNMLTRLQNKIDLALVKTKTFESNTLTVESGVVHVYTKPSGLSHLVIKYPDSKDFISTVIFSTARSGAIAVKFPPNTKFAGRERLKFYPGETWELNIHSGRVAGTLLTD